jgi:hypothetical protein
MEVVSLVIVLVGVFDCRDTCLCVGPATHFRTHADGNDKGGVQRIMGS